MRFSINANNYTVENEFGKFFWILWDKRGHCVDECSDFLDSACEAQQDAIRHTRRLQDSIIDERDAEFFGTAKTRRESASWEVV